MRCLSVTASSDKRAPIPCGLPLHYHLVWMLANGMDTSLESLWYRRDYSMEIYDLAWSFAAFCLAWIACG